MQHVPQSALVPHARHARLFELIRQGNLADQNAVRTVIPTASVSAEVQAFRQQAERSITPQSAG